jgi:hypothetical protein
MLVTGNCDYIDANSAAIGFVKAKFPGIGGLVRYWGWDKWQAIPQQSTFWRRSLIAEIGLFNPELHFVMDLEFWLRAAKRYPIRIIDQTLAGFRLMVGTKTMSRTSEMYLEEYATFRRFRHVLPRRARVLASIEARRHCARLLVNFAEHLVLTAGLRRKPGELLLAAFKLWPPSAYRSRFLLAAANCLLSLVTPKPWLDTWHRKALRIVGRAKTR